MEWSHDFCLFCDRQTSGGAYCSQACRVADLEKSGYSEPQTPSGSLSSSGAWQTQSSNRQAQFQLAPALNFAAYRTSTSSTSRLDSPPMSPRSMQPQQTSSYFSSSTSSSQLTTYTQSTKPRLNNSSSRSSLSSIATMSTTTTQGLSDQAYTQLRDYSNSFDNVRYWKRRVTLG